MMTRLIFLVFLFVSSSSNAMVDGKRLNQFCNVLEEKALCLMYIRGLDDARRLVEQKLDPDKPGWMKDFCIPGEIRWTEKREVVSTFLLAHKEHWEKPAYYSYVQAFKEQYPCDPP